MPKSWEQILGGYATNTLTEGEKRQLFEAALHDQPLFDVLADEEALKVLLADPEARQRILASLQASENSHVPTTASRRSFSWFRRPSSLAWAGSIAAMGLALIFGWQMEKDWGPLVSQEQKGATSSARDDIAFRAEQSQLENQEREAGKEKKDKRLLLNEVKPQSVPVPEADSNMDNHTDRLGQVPMAAKKERRANEEELAPSPLRMQERVSQASDTVSESSQPQAKPAVQPLAMPDVAEVVKPEAAKLAAARERFADQAAMEKPLPPGALDLFYAELGPKEGADSQLAKTDSDNPARKKGVAKPSMSKAKSEDGLSVQGERQGGEAVLRRAKGIRYSFVRETKDDEEELAEGQQITGDWRDVRLAIELNESGFLYVFAPLGNNKWQPFERMTVPNQGDNPDIGKVEAYQIVEFRLSAITNILGKLVVSSITVLFSPTPIENWGKWLGGNVRVPELQTERTDDSVYVVRPEAAPDVPFRVDISLEE